MIGPAEIGVICFLAGLLIGAGVALSVMLRVLREQQRALKDLGGCGETRGPQ